MPARVRRFALILCPVVTPALAEEIGDAERGATAALSLAKDSDGALEVTLVETNPTYTTRFLSNLDLGGFLEFESLQHCYDKIAGVGVTAINDMATAADRAAKTVTLASGTLLPFDRLIQSPGIDFKDGSVAGWSLIAPEDGSRSAPRTSRRLKRSPAWKASSQPPETTPPFARRPTRNRLTVV